MKRRDFIVGAMASAIWPRCVCAQSLPRLGVLTRAGHAQNDWFKEFEAAFEKLGWRQGQNIRIDRRWTSDEADLPGLDAVAKELVSLRPDVILAHSSPVVAALQRLTSTIPIVFVSVNDPVTAGFVASLSHPGGNITGFANFEPSLAGKLIQILKEVAPNIRRVAIMYNSQSYYTTSRARFFEYARAMQQAASSQDVDSIDSPIRSEADIESLIARLGTDPASGLVVIPDPYIGIGPRRALLVSLTARYRVPAIYPFSFFVTDGGLVSYGNDLPEAFRQAATYVDRILKGDRPSELPVQLPTKFQLVVNLKTAKALGLTVPPTLLGRADEVIE